MRTETDTEDRRGPTASGNDPVETAELRLGGQETRVGVEEEVRALHRGEIFRAWWPLAASWALMALEMPAVGAVLARLDSPEINLAAWGGLVFPIAILIEAPVIMLLATSTALSRDWDSYLLLRRFANFLCAGLTLLHAIVVFTPVYFFVAERVIQAPPEIVGPARYGLMIMLPFAWGVGLRRLNQGLLIRAGRSLAVGLGTAVRLLTQVALLVAGYFIGATLGVVVAATAIIGGVLAEALFAWVQASSCRTQLSTVPPSFTPLTLRALLRFFVPLALTTVLSLGANSLASAGMSRMPLALESLAAWPVMMGAAFLLRSLGIAYNEVVLALIERPGSYTPLRRFAAGLSFITTVALLLFLLPVTKSLWFEGLSGLSPSLAGFVQSALWFAIPLPALAVSLSWFQGLVLHSRKTRYVTEAMVLFLAVLVMVLIAGVIWGRTPGLYVAVAGMSLSESARVVWLRLRSREAREKAAVVAR